MEKLLRKIKSFWQKEAPSASPFSLLSKKLTGNKRRFSSDQKLVYSLARTKIPRQEQLKHLAKILDPREKVLLKVAVLAFLVSFVYIGFRFYQDHLILLPKIGGTYREGLVGYPQNINPLYSSSRDVDSDLSRLLYAGLFRYDENGRLVSDLADSWQLEDGGKVYIIKLKEGLKWSDGGDLSADDVVFTFNLIKTPEYRSPLRGVLGGVELEKQEDASLRFVLAEPYADFLSLLTFGIMPQRAWEAVSPEAAPLSELNLKPIGSGPYRFDSLIKSKGGEMKEYHMVANEYYHGPKPYISKIIFKFFPDYTNLVQALNGNDIDGASYVPDDLKKDVLAKHSLFFRQLRLSQIDAIFFNQENNKALADKRVRQALAYGIDRNRLLGEVMGGVSRADGPILAPDFVSLPENLVYNLDSNKAAALLEEAGYKSFFVDSASLAGREPLAEEQAILSYASSTQVSPDGNWRLKIDGKQVQILTIKLAVPESGRIDVAEAIKQDWEKLGVRVQIDSVSATDLGSSLLAGHNFQSLLYGQIVGLEADVSPFWHSSQIGGQGLNLAGYNSSAADTLLTEARQLSGDFAARQEKYRRFQEMLAVDVPAIFLYSPSYNYVQDKRVRGFAGGLIEEPSDRFAGVCGWYIKTKKSWSW